MFKVKMIRTCKDCGCEYEYDGGRNSTQCVPCWRRHHNETGKAWAKRNYEDWRKKAREAGREWRKNNPDKFLPRHAIYQKLIRAVDDRTDAVNKWIALCEKYHNVCLACGEPGDYTTLTVDHIVPLSKGGEKSFSNIQPLCFTCNRSKGNKTIDYRHARYNAAHLVAK